MSLYQYQSFFNDIYAFIHIYTTFHLLIQNSTSIVLYPQNFYYRSTLLLRMSWRDPLWGVHGVHHSAQLSDFRGEQHSSNMEIKWLDLVCCCKQAGLLCKISGLYFGLIQLSIHHFLSTFLFTNYKAVKPNILSPWHTSHNVSNLFKSKMVLRPEPPRPPTHHPLLSSPEKCHWNAGKFTLSRFLKIKQRSHGSNLTNLQSFQVYIMYFLGVQNLSHFYSFLIEYSHTVIPSFRLIIIEHPHETKDFWIPKRLKNDGCSLIFSGKMCLKEVGRSGIFPPIALGGSMENGAPSCVNETLKKSFHWTTEFDKTLERIILYNHHMQISYIFTLSIGDSSFFHNHDSVVRWKTKVVQPSNNFDISFVSSQPKKNQLSQGLTRVLLLKLPCWENQHIPVGTLESIYNSFSRVGYVIVPWECFDLGTIEEEDMSISTTSQQQIT